MANWLQKFFGNPSSASEPTVNEQAGLGPEWQEVQRAPIIPGQQTGAPPSPNQMGPYFAGSISPALQHDATFVGTKYGTPSIASFPLVPPGPSGIPTVNAAIKSAVPSVTPVSPPVTFNGMVFKGNWSSSVAYAVSNVVIFNKSAYLALQANTNVQPDGDADPPQWQLLSENLLFNGTYTFSSTGGIGAFDNYATAAVHNSNSISVGPLTPTTPPPPYTAVTGYELAIFAFYDTNADGLSSLSGWDQVLNLQNLYSKLVPYGTPVTATASGLTAGSNIGANLLLFPYGVDASATATQVTIVSHTVTVVVANNFIVGSKVSFAGMTATALNGNSYTILTQTPTQITFSAVLADYGPTADSGTASSVGIRQAAIGTSGTINSTTMTFANPVAAGSTLLLVWFGANDFQAHSGTIGSVSDTVNGSWPDIVNTPVPIYAGPSVPGVAHMAFIQNVAAGSTTITANAIGSPSANIAGSSTIAFEIVGGSPAPITYEPYDVVEWTGSIYVCLQQTTTGPAISPSNWGLLGSTGANVLTTLGDILSVNSTPANVRVPGNITTTTQFLSQTGTGSVSALPAWTTLGTSILPPIWNVVTETANYSANPKDFVLANTGSGGFTVTLPLAASCADQMIGVKKTSNDTNVLTVAASGSDLIDGSSTQTELSQWNMMIYLSSGTAWYIVSLEKYDYAADTGTANAYIIAPTPTVSAYVTGQLFSFKAANANTIASTLAVSGLSAKAIKKFGSLALTANDIQSGQIVTVIYDGTNFQMISEPGNVTGTGAIVLANSPALTGSPTAPTQLSGDNSTLIATDAFVQAAISGSVAGIDVLELNSVTIINPYSLSALVNGVGPVGEVKLNSTLVTQQLLPSVTNEETPPTFPSPYDDEFTGTGLKSIWTANSGNKGQTITYNSPIASSLRCTLAAGTAGNNSFYSISQPFVPGAGDFNITLKAQLPATTASQSVFLGVGDTANDSQVNGYTFYYTFVSASTPQIRCDKYIASASTQGTGWATVNRIGTGVCYPSHIWLHLRRTAGTYTAYFSLDGVGGFFPYTGATFNAAPLVRFINIGFAQYAQPNPVFSGTFDWLRVNWLTLP